EPTAIGRMRDVFVRQVAPAIARFCADPAQAPARAALVASQVLGMALCRHVLRVPPAVGLTKEELVEWLGPTFQRYLAD
ncbi:MAG: TetR/AcrR family transcriptional regulator, partial [Nonomuraea sp.]|nr:TetR/AcrR family transcriptional regulator [Nonomuraea sp.]